MASLKVAVRVRPFNQREIEMGSHLIVQMEAKKTRLYKSARGGIVARDQFNDFTFDYSYASIDHMDPNYATQDQVYEDLGTDVIECAFQGYNACVFAYGQTGSGKTFTMMGTAEMQGLIPRICKALFARMQLGADTGIGYKTHVSYLEIYNEKVKDLLGTDNSGHNLKVREHRVLGPYVENLSQHPVSDYPEIQQCIYRGNNLRTTASTNMNDTSSRSHAIFTITFVQADFRNDMPSETVSKIHLVDLAGSERANATGATGQRLKEGAHINKSLVTLGSVISALADQTNAVQNKKLSYIPYRDSILTWLLKDSLGGNSKTIMIAAISPADCNYSETLSTLRYANRAKNIINKPTINEDPNVKLIRELREEINTLKSLLVNESVIPRPPASYRRKPSFVRRKRSSVEPSLKMLEDLQKKEAQEKVLTEEWTEKWREAQSILREQKSLGLRKSGFGVVLDSEIPHLIGIHDDISTGVTLYSLKEGETTIGTDEIDIQPDIVLSGMGILPEHCSIVLANGNATIYPRQSAQCWLNANLIEEPSRICQGDILLLGRTNMFRFNNPAEAAILRKDPSRSRLDLSRLSLIAASRENLNFCFHNDDDNTMMMSSSTSSPYKRDRQSQFYHQSIDFSTREESEMDSENRKILETIESALGQLKFERLQMHEQYKKKVTKLKEEILRLELEEKDQLAILECREKELLARKEMLLWEKDNEKVQVDIIVRQLTTMQSELELKKQNFIEFIEKELQNLQECGKLDELNITVNDGMPIEESSEVLLVISKSLDSSSAQYIKDTIKKSRDDISRLEVTVTEKQDLVTDSSRKIDEIDEKLVEIDRETNELNVEKMKVQLDELEIRKKSLNLNLNHDDAAPYPDNMDTFHTANSDCSILSPASSSSADTTYPIMSNQKKLMSDSGVCLDTNQKVSHDGAVATIASVSAAINRGELSSTESTTSNGDKSSASEEIHDDSESCCSYENNMNSSPHYKYLMVALREKIAAQKAEIMKNLEKDSSKPDVDRQIENLQALQKEYLKMELEFTKGLSGGGGDTTPEDGSLPRNSGITADSIGDNRSHYPNFSSESSDTTETNPSGFNPNLHRPSLPRGNYSNEHTIAIPNFIVRGAGKQTHYEYEIRINLPDARWTLLRRYSRFRELHLHMKSCYGQKVSQIPFPRREIFSSNSESIAKQRRRQLESYLRRLLQVCAKIPQCPLYEGNGGSGLTKLNLIQLSPFFKKGLFESGKHGTG